MLISYLTSFSVYTFIYDSALIVHPPWLHCACVRYPFFFSKNSLHTIYCMTYLKAETRLGAKRFVIVPSKMRGDCNSSFRTIVHACTARMFLHDACLNDFYFA